VQDLQIMDDPDVDHELIALLRESLGFSNKAQVGVSDNTGKTHTSLLRLSPLFQSIVQCYEKNTRLPTLDIFRDSG
jgi:hypothetical protein